jgi:hypothetical protein
MTTPAQAYGHPTLDDVPVSGPTDPGILKADCWFAQHVLPTPQNTPCVDCKGTIPMAVLKLKPGLSSEWGFGVGAAGDPDVWTTLSPAQQTWVMNTLITLDTQIRKSTNTTCPTFGPSITAAGGCFQRWFNSQNFGLTTKQGGRVELRVDGVFDQDTLDALRTVVALHAKDFPTPFPGTEMAGTGTPAKKLSTGAMVGIGAGVAAVGGVIYAATRKGGRRKGRKASRRR